jgi:hypothetical protein
LAGVCKVISGSWMIHFVQGSVCDFSGGLSLCNWILRVAVFWLHRFLDPL